LAALYALIAITGVALDTFNLWPFNGGQTSTVSKRDPSSRAQRAPSPPKQVITLEEDGDEIRIFRSGRKAPVGTLWAQVDEDETTIWRPDSAMTILDLLSNWWTPVSMWDIYGLQETIGVLGDGSFGQRSWNRLAAASSDQTLRKNIEEYIKIRAEQNRKSKPPVDPPRPRVAVQDIPLWLLIVSGILVLFMVATSMPFWHRIMLRRVFAAKGVPDAESDDEPGDPFEVAVRGEAAPEVSTEVREEVREATAKLKDLQRDVKDQLVEVKRLEKLTRDNLTDANESFKQLKQAVFGSSVDELDKKKTKYLDALRRIARCLKVQLPDYSPDELYNDSLIQGALEQAQLAGRSLDQQSTLQRDLQKASAREQSLIVGMDSFSRMQISPRLLLRDGTEEPRDAHDPSQVSLLLGVSEQFRVLNLLDAIILPLEHITMQVDGSLLGTLGRIHDNLNVVSLHERSERWRSEIPDCISKALRGLPEATSSRNIDEDWRRQETDRRFLAALREQLFFESGAWDRVISAILILRQFCETYFQETQGRASFKPAESTDADLRFFMRRMDLSALALEHLLEDMSIQLHDLRIGDAPPEPESGQEVRKQGRSQWERGDSLSKLYGPAMLGGVLAPMADHAVLDILRWGCNVGDKTVSPSRVVVNSQLSGSV